MSGREEAVLIECDGDRMVGVLHRGRPEATRGALIVVGGPQYRVGSHRQFLYLARELADRGLPALRFDYRGMGDSEGAQRSFEEIEADISAALDEFFRRVPSLRDVVLWGLCDAASAAVMYACCDSRVSGLALLNPWFRTDATLARTHLRRYYSARLLDPAFWKRFLAGRVNLLRVVSGLYTTMRNLLRPAAPGRADPGGHEQPVRAPFTDRMRDGLTRFKGPVLFVLSGQDLTAAEFVDATSASSAWSTLLRRPTVRRIKLEEANHTFARREWRDRVSEITLEWMTSW